MNLPLLLLRIQERENSAPLQLRYLEIINESLNKDHLQEHFKGLEKKSWNILDSLSKIANVSRDWQIISISY